MRNLCLLSLLLCLSCLGLNAQTLPDKIAVTHFYMVNLDEDLANVFTYKSAKTPDKYSVGDVVASIIDTFYTIAAERFKNELGLQLLPLNELKSRIKYNSLYPNCPDLSNIKKVLKCASGYNYYTDFFVNIFSELNTESPVRPLPNKIKPLYAISFTLYDNTGKIVQKIDFSYKSRQALSESSKADFDRNSQQLKSKLCDLYAEALNGFEIVCKKKLTAQL